MSLITGVKRERDEPLPRGEDNDPIEYSANHEYRRQIAVEKRFFRPQAILGKHQEEMLRIKNEMLAIRTAGSSAVESLDLSGAEARIVIIAEACISQACFPKGQANQYGFHNVDSSVSEAHFKPDLLSKHTKQSDKWPTQWTGEEQVILTQRNRKRPSAKTTYVQKVNPHKNHKGDCIIVAFGSYASNKDRLTQLVNEPYKEQGMATLLLNSAKHLYAITPEDIAQALHITRPSVEPDLITFINDLRYLLFVKEIARRQVPEDEDHELPFATSLIRALTLVKHGHLKLMDVLGSDAPYGAFTGREIGKNEALVKKKIFKINRIYREHFQVPITTISTDATQSASSRQFLKRDLSTTFGAGSDTDDAGYDS